MSQLTLYFNPMSQPSRAVLALVLLGEVEVDCRIVQVGKDTKTEDYLQINPFGTVPSMIDDNMPIYESMSILRYLCRTQAGCKKYYPSDPKQQLKADIYMDWHHQGLRSNVNEYFFATIGWKIYGQPQPNKIFLENSKINICKALDNLDKVFLGGDKSFSFMNKSKSMTIADLICVMELAQLFLINFDFSKWINVSRWLLTMFSVPEVEQACDVLLTEVTRNILKPTELIRQIIDD